MLRRVLRRPAVREATGLSDSTLDRMIKSKQFPAPIRLDPTRRAVVWFEDEIEAFQKAAVAAATTEAA